MQYNPDIECYKIINNVADAPPDSLLFYNIKGGLGYVHRKDYELFCLYYIESNHFYKHHTMDLAFAKYHNVVLDIDFKGQYSADDLSDYMTTHLRPNLKHVLDDLPCFTYISAMRPEGGLHIHLCELLITHDDYIHFCTKLQQKMNVKTARFEVKVDIPTNFTLATATKPDTTPYIPFNICYVDHSTDICLPLSDRTSYTQERTKLSQKKFKTKKSNANSIFRKLLFYQYDQVVREVWSCMMPYVVFSGIQPLRITYQTLISKEPVTGFTEIGHLSYETGTFTLFKANKLNVNALDWLMMYHYLNNHCCRIKTLDTANRAIRRWYDRIQKTMVTEEDIFKPINQLIKEDNAYWRTDVHPLRTMMHHDDGLYFLPLYYALCNTVENTHPHDLLTYFTGSSLDPLINRLKMIDATLLKDVAEKFTHETILYCASNVCLAKLNPRQDHGSILEKIDRILHNMKDTVLSCKSKLDYEEVIRTIIQRYTPLIMGLYKHSSKKSARLLWNILLQHWQEISPEEVKHHVQLIFHRIECLLEDVQKYDPMFKKVQSHQIAQTVNGISNIERKEIEMDHHKFHVRTKAGILHVLTSQICSTVPEFFISNKSINIDFPRHEWNALYDDPDLIHIYQEVTSKTFFRQFLKYLLVNESDDFFDTLKLLATERGLYPNHQRYKHLDSILHFYGHLCKYMSFDYDMVLFMLTVLASIFISTNYYRRFFVFQGNTKNGKSKFFELIEKVFGSYSHSIRSINLQTNKNGSGAQPELATSLHSCRIIAVEELHGKIDENFIKILTGNSQVSCRQLYETNAGGIPTAKVFASTNNPPECIATDAFRDRVLVVPFSASFSEQASPHTSEQVMNNVYKMDWSDAIVRNSYVGMFLLSYCHLLQKYDRETGLINLPPLPEVMVEFKEEYLKMTDIYAQFKQYVDLQIVTDTKLMYNELVSSVRKFLINTKSHLNLESSLLMRFDEEFAHYKQETSSEYDFNAPIEDVEDEPPEDEGEMNEVYCVREPPEKKKKMTIFYYQNISIKQLKRVKF